MKTNDNQSKRIYDKTTKQWYEIPEDQYREYDRWRTALRKHMQYRGECFYPHSKWWLCDGNCLDCEFRNNKTVSLDDPLPDGKGRSPTMCRTTLLLLKRCFPRRRSWTSCLSVGRSSSERPTAIRTTMPSPGRKPTSQNLISLWSKSSSTKSPSSPTSSPWNLSQGLQSRSRHKKAPRPDTFAGSEEPWSVFFLIVPVPRYAWFFGIEYKISPLRSHSK